MTARLLGVAAAAGAIACAATAGALLLPAAVLGGLAVVLGEAAGRMLAHRPPLGADTVRMLDRHRAREDHPAGKAIRPLTRKEILEARQQVWQSRWDRQ